MAMMEEICIPDSDNIVRSITTNYFFALKQNGKAKADLHGLTYILIFVSRFLYVIAKRLLIC